MKTFDQDDDVYIGETVHFQSYADKQVLAEHLADDVAAMLRAGLNERGYASIAVSGGSTPKPFFAALAKHNLDWPNVYVTLVDERWVDGDHADSNEALLRDNLKVNARFIGLKNAEETPYSGYKITHNELSVIPRPFDVIVLGMGDDGHTASFFPHAEGLEGALNPTDPTISVAPVTPPDYAPHPRITLTLPAILDSRRIILHITSGKKQEVYAKACEAGAVEDMPVRAVLRQEQTPVEVYWAA